MIDDPARCGYSRCRAELPAPGPRGGRPRAFCRDTRWDGDRTCAQMARAERDALDSLGLDSGRAAFHLDADRLREHVDTVRAPVAALLAALDGVTARLDEVQAGAVAAVELAYRQVAEADTARRGAQQDREQAEALTRQARDGARRAVAERAEAVERAAAAARQALEATEALGAARHAAERAMADHAAADRRADRMEHERNSAVTAARDAAVRAERAMAGSEAQRARASEWEETAERLRSERDGAGERCMRAEERAGAAEAAREESDARVSAAERAVVAAGAAREHVERALRVAEARADGERSLRLRADGELERLRAELAEARSAAAADLRALVVAATGSRPATEPSGSAQDSRS